MALLGKDDIIKAADGKTEIVEVPEWGGEVLIKTLSGRERDKYETGMVTLDPKTGQQVPNLDNLRARYCALVMIREDGQPLFKSNREVEELGKKSANALDRVYDAAQKLNGTNDKAVEEAVEDFGETPSESSTSD